MSQRTRHWGGCRKTLHSHFREQVALTASLFQEKIWGGHGRCAALKLLQPGVLLLQRPLLPQQLLVSLLQSLLALFLGRRTLLGVDTLAAGAVGGRRGARGLRQQGLLLGAQRRHYGVPQGVRAGDAAGPDAAPAHLCPAQGALGAHLRLARRVRGARRQRRARRGSQGGPRAGPRRRRWRHPLRQEVGVALGDGGLRVRDLEPGDAGRRVAAAVGAAGVRVQAAQRGRGVAGRADRAGRARLLLLLRGVVGLDAAFPTADLGHGRGVGRGLAWCRARRRGCGCRRGGRLGEGLQLI